MSNPGPKRTPLPGKKVELTRSANTSSNGNLDSGAAKCFKAMAANAGDTDEQVLTVKEIKKLKFSMFDYKQKFKAKVVYMTPPREHKSTDVHNHRRTIVLADNTDFIKGYVRSNNDHFLMSDKSYMFSKYKIYRHVEILIHDDTIKYK